MAPVWMKNAAEQIADGGFDDPEEILDIIKTCCPFKPDTAYQEVGPDLSIRQVIDANLSRVHRWHGLEDWTPLEWAGAMCGEAGEAANFAKKLKRVQSGIPNRDARIQEDLAVSRRIEQYRKGVGMECADAFIYSVLLCARVNVDLVACIKEAFNGKSIEYGFPERL